jgi:DNA ligase-1
MTDFKPMLAHSKSPDPEDLSYPIIVQPKLDGVRASVVNGRLVSRTLKAIPNAEIRAALERPEFEGLDGELIVGDPTAEDCYRQTCSFVMAENKTSPGPHHWAFFAFDLWNHPGTYSERADALRKLHLPAHVGTVACVTVGSVEQLESIEEYLVSEGYEGAILRDPNGLYKFGRSGKTGPLLKLKRFIDFEAVVIGVYEELHNGNVAKTNALGRTERSSHAAGKTGKGTLGGLELRALNGPAEGVEFRCGTGFDAADRLALWLDHHHGDPLVGKVAKVKSFPIGVKDKPRHPVFLGWRDMEVDG